MVGLKTLIKRLWGEGDNAGAQALDAQQSDSDARIGQLQREFAEHPGRGLTPKKLYDILEAAEQGDLRAQHELFEDMEEKDPQIAADLAKRRQLAAEREWQIVPPDNPSAAERRATEHAIEVFSGLEVEDLILDLGSAIGHGWALLELPWARDGAQRFVEQPQFRPHAWFRLHPERQDELRLRDASHAGAELWPLGWVQHRHRAKAGYVARAGLHRVLAWPYLFQNYALGDLAKLLELYGLPARIGTYPKNATDKEKATLLRAVTSLGHNAAGIIPEGMAIEFMEAAGKSAGADMFMVMLRWCEAAKSRAILGGTLTSGTSGDSNTNALGNVHERSQTSLIRSDARQYAGTINRDILWPMAALNFGITDRRRAPRFYLDTGETADLAHLAKTLPTFVDMGMHIPVWWSHEKSGIPEATEEEIAAGRVLQPRTGAQPFGALKGARAQAIAALRARAPAPGADPVDAIVPALGRDAQPQVDGWLDQVERLLAAEPDLTPTELQSRLLDLYGGLPTDELVEIMSQAYVLATLRGMSEVSDGR
jgi:phage gp29-like protein